MDIEKLEESFTAEETPQKARIGWAESAQALALANDDQLVMPDFPNDEDERLEW